MQAARQFARVAPAAARSLSTSSAAASGLVRPPIQLYSLEGRYAHALFSAAAKTDALGSVEKEVGSLKALIAKDAGFAGFLDTPIVSNTEKTAVCKDVMAKLKYSETMTNMISVMSENNALPITKGVIAAYEQLMSAHRNEIQCKITSAKPLSKGQLDTVKKSLAGFTGGSVMNVDVAVDAKIMGGLIVEVGDNYIDMSTKSKINKIVSLMNEN